MDYVGQLTLIYKATCRKFLSVKFIIVVFTVMLLQAEIFKKKSDSRGVYVASRNAFDDEKNVPLKSCC